MKISEQAVRHLIGSMLLESLLKEGEENGSDEYTIPNLPKGYATLYALLKERKVTGDRMASVKSLRDFFGEKFLFKGDQIFISDITGDVEKPRIISYKDHETNVFDKRGTVTAVLKMIKDAREKNDKINIGDDIKKQVLAQTTAAVAEKKEEQNDTPKEEVDEQKTSNNSNNSTSTIEVTEKRPLLNYIPTKFLSFMFFANTEPDKDANTILEDKINYFLNEQMYQVLLDFLNVKSFVTAINKIKEEKKEWISEITESGNNTSITLTSEFESKIITIIDIIMQKKIKKLTGTLEKIFVNEKEKKRVEKSQEEIVGDKGNIWIAYENKEKKINYFNVTNIIKHILQLKSVQQIIKKESQNVTQSNTAPAPTETKPTETSAPTKDVKPAETSETTTSTQPQQSQQSATQSSDMQQIATAKTNKTIAENIINQKPTFDDNYKLFSMHKDDKKVDPDLDNLLKDPDFLTICQALIKASDINDLISAHENEENKNEEKFTQNTNNNLLLSFPDNINDQFDTLVGGNLIGSDKQKQKKIDANLQKLKNNYISLFHGTDNRYVKILKEWYTSGYNDYKVCISDNTAVFYDFTSCFKALISELYNLGVHINVWVKKENRRNSSRIDFFTGKSLDESADLLLRNYIGMLLRS